MPSPPENFLNVLDEIQSKLMDLLPSLTSKLSTLSDNELSLIARELDFFQELNRFGYSEALDDLMTKYDDEATEIFAEASKRGLKVSVGTARSLELIKELDATTLLGRASEYSSKLKSELLRGIISGESSENISKRLMESIGKELSSSSVNMIVNDSFARFSNSATFKAFADSPGQKYKYIGVLDGVTRDVCKAVLTSKQNQTGFTEDEINSLPVRKDTRGGFNCRHDWVLA